MYTTCISYNILFRCIVEISLARLLSVRQNSRGTGQPSEGKQLCPVLVGKVQRRKYRLNSSDLPKVQVPRTNSAHDPRLSKNSCLPHWQCVGEVKLNCTKGLARRQLKHRFVSPREEPKCKGHFIIGLRKNI